MAEDVQDPGLGRRDPCFLLEPKTIRPGNQRSEEQLIVDQDDHQHRADRPSDRGEVAPLDGESDVRANARQHDRGVADSNCLRSHDKEPAARHRHHHVPNELRHRKGHLDPPEAHPWGKPEGARCFEQLGRDRPQRLVEAERHVPGLAREDGEDRRELRPENAIRRQRHEKDDGNRDEAEDRDRLKNVEQRQEQQLGPSALRRQGRIGEGEQQRQAQCRQHAQRRAGGVARKMRGIERDRRGLQRGEGLHEPAAGVGEEDQQTKDQQNRECIPAAECEHPLADGDRRHRGCHRRHSRRAPVPFIRRSTARRASHRWGCLHRQLMPLRVMPGHHPSRQEAPGPGSSPKSGSRPARYKVDCRRS